jgi:histidine triad (HIT) family protein
MTHGGQLDTAQGAVHAQQECTFCGIARHGAEASIVLRTATVTAFLDRFPVAAGHVLVVPNDHYPSLADLPDTISTDMWRVATTLLAVVRGRLAPAVMLHVSDGEAAGQDVPHAHLHVIPRHPGDAVTVDLPGRRPSRDELDAIAADLARHLT